MRAGAGGSRVVTVGVVLAGVLLLGVGAGCGGAAAGSGDAAADAVLPVDAGVGGDATPPGSDARFDAAGPAGDGPLGDGGGGSDAAAGVDGPAGGDAGTYRDSLAVCWTDPACPRVLAVGHGGAWNAVSAPYDSNAALAAAYADGLDGVKIDVRVTADDVPVIAHSSPIEYYESLDCGGRRIEEMTAAQVTGCHRVPSLTEKFQRLDDVLTALRGRLVVQLCVKESGDFARTIAEVHAQGAEDFAFIELSPTELQTLIPTIPGSDTVYYLVNVAADLAAVDGLLAFAHPGAVLYEFDPTVSLGTLVTAKLHPAGVRAFTYDDTTAASPALLQGHYQAGFDVVSANATDNLLQARIAVNQSRGVSPP
jgi:glycerophosphoryl diester phosphodiesterase